jgi:uncharacterized membrane protein SpoIIM required for sporulation
MLMVCGSLPWIRSRFYEAFKLLHITLAILFFVFLFWHITGEYITVSPTAIIPNIADVYSPYISG